MSNKLRPVFRTDCLITPDLATLIPKERPEIVQLLEFVECVPLHKFHVKKTGAGPRQYDPRMVLAVIIYAFMNRVFSSRSIETLIRYEDRFKYIAGLSVISFVTICRFIQNNGKAIGECLTQFLLVAMEKNLLTGKNVGMDGTKLKANASLSETMTVEAIQARLVEIEGDIKACHLLMAEQVLKETLHETPLLGNDEDGEEDSHDDQMTIVIKDLEELAKSQHRYMQALSLKQVDNVDSGKDKCGEVADQKPLEHEPTSAKATAPTNDEHLKRLKQLTYEKKKSERALEQAKLDKQDQAEYQLRKQRNQKHIKQLQSQRRDATSTTTTNRKSKQTGAPQTSVPVVKPHVLPEPTPEEIKRARDQAKMTPKQKVNRTDPHSRIMKPRAGGHIQGLNVQAMVDLGSGIIISTNVVSDQNDTQVMSANLAKVDERLGQPTNLVADKGYNHQREIEETELLGINVIVPPRQKSKNTKSSEFRTKMTEKIDQPESKKLMKSRSFVVEGAFAQFKENLNYRKIYRRGLEAVNKEIELLAIAHNFKRYTKLVNP